MVSDLRRVIQFSTGNVGRHSLQAIIGRPDLELVGVHASSAQKVGRDAADLCGLSEATGIIATDDIDALLALGADCVVYTSQGETRPMEAIEQMSRFLAAGVNVELDEVRQRTESWHATERIECVMATIEPGQLAGARFAVEGGARGRKHPAGGDGPRADVVS